MNVTQAALAAKVTPSRIRVLIADGTLQAEKRPGGQYEVEERSFQQWMESRIPRSHYLPNVRKSKINSKVA